MHNLVVWIWLAILIVGIVSSVAKRAVPARPVSLGAPRQQAPAPQKPLLAGPLPGPAPRRAATQARRSAAPPRQAAVPATPAALAPVEAHPFPAGARPRSRARRFADRESVVAGIVAAQIFGKPGGLSDEY